MDDQYQTLSHLLHLANQGDQSSYAQFLTLCSAIIRRYVQRRIKTEEAEDVVQEILISIHKAKHTYDATRPVMPWLIAIMRFRIADYLRKHYGAKRQEMVSIEDVMHLLEDVTESPSGNESILEILRHVPQRQQKILSLMVIEGYTAKEVGAQLQMNESAVKVAAHRALKKLKGIIA